MVDASMLPYLKLHQWYKRKKMWASATKQTVLCKKLVQEKTLLKNVSTPNR